MENTVVPAQGHSTINGDFLYFFRLDAMEQEILAQLAQYNSDPNHLKLHPETAEKILSIQRKIFPAKLKYNSLLDCLRVQNWSEGDLENLTKVNDLIKGHGVQGLSMTQLKVRTS